MASHEVAALGLLAAAGKRLPHSAHLTFFVNLTKFRKKTLLDLLSTPLDFDEVSVETLLFGKALKPKAPGAASLPAGRQSASGLAFGMIFSMDRGPVVVDKAVAERCIPSLVPVLA